MAEDKELVLYSGIVPDSGGPSVRRENGEAPARHGVGAYPRGGAVARFAVELTKNAAEIGSARFLHAVTARTVRD